MRDEFRRDPALPILVENDTFIKAIHRGVEQGEYVYRRGDLLYGKGDPMAMIIVDEQSVIFTSGYAQQHSIGRVRLSRSPAGTQELVRERRVAEGFFGPGAGPIATPGGGPGFSSGGSVEPGARAEAFTAKESFGSLVKLWEQSRAARLQKSVPSRSRCMSRAMRSSCLQ